MRRVLPVLAALVALTLVPALAGARAHHHAARKVVHVHDNYYEPAKLTVKRGTVVVWKWPAVTGDSHDVTLKKGPKGVRRFQSAVAAAAYSYKRRLTVPGTYRIVCSLHEGMTMKIVVRR